MHPTARQGPLDPLALLDPQAPPVQQVQQVLEAQVLRDRLDPSGRRAPLVLLVPQVPRTALLARRGPQVLQDPPDQSVRQVPRMVQQELLELLGQQVLLGQLAQRELQMVQRARLDQQVPQVLQDQLEQPVV